MRSGAFSARSNIRSESPFFKWGRGQKHYGADSIEVVTHNPYRLAIDVYGIGFVTADAIARNLGIAAHSEYRFRSALLHVLNQAGEEGHCYLPQPELISRTVQCLTLPDFTPKPDQVEFLLHCMAEEQEVIIEVEPNRTACYAPAFFYAEQNVARRLLALLQSPLPCDLARVTHWLDRFTQRHHLQLSPQQQQAVHMAASQRLLVLTGGPGTGKTFTTRTIVALWQAMGKTVALASPTGRAAQRLAEVTSTAAKTIHRLLEFDPSNLAFKRGPDSPITADAIVIDEASMLDLFLANALVKDIPPTAQLLLVGDRDQLPSVGPGSILNDLIASQQVPVVQLQEVFRQAQTSQIITHAHCLNRGELPQIERVSDHPQSDCLFLSAPDETAGIQALSEVVQSLLPALGIRTVEQVQVLVPMTRGLVGTRNLNQVLQQLLNPPAPGKAELQRGSSTLRVGDRVIQVVNDYTREVFNGDLGTIATINLEDTEITVQFGDRLVTYDAADLNELALAWAISIHKSQGSEFPVVILPIFMQHYLLLSRNLIYTGLTRAKQLAIFIGQPKAMHIAVQQIKDRQRYTKLADRLKPVAIVTT